MAIVVFGVEIDDICAADFRRCVEDWLEGTAGRVVVTPNAEMLLLSRHNPAFRALLNRSDLSIPDAVSLKFAAAVLCHHRLVNRLPGVDALETIAWVCQQRGRRLLLLGGGRDTAARAATALRHQFPTLKVIGMDPGSITFDGHRIDVPADLVDAIVHRNPDVVAVGLGQGKQEFAIDALKAQLPQVKIWIGVGGALDMTAGVRPRAPRWIRRVGCEWLWRLLIEPRRLPRTLRAVILFPLCVLTDALVHRKIV